MIRKTHPKAKYSCIPPEEFKQGVLYSFSFNPEEQPIFDKFYKVKLNTLQSWSHAMLKIFNDLRYSKLQVFLEVSRRGRFHYHGVIQVMKPLEFVIHDAKMLAHYGCYEIDTIADMQKWLTYCMKQQELITVYAEKNNMAPYYNTLYDDQ